MDEQLKTQFLQQFDSLFFSLLKQLVDRIDSSLNTTNFKKSYIKVLLSRDFDDSEEGIEKARDLHLNLNLMNEKIHNIKDIQLIFSLLYQILKNIDREGKVISASDKIFEEKYIGILRSCIPNEILYLLIIYLVTSEKNPNFNDYKKLAEFFSLFEHISLNTFDYSFDSMIICIPKLRPSAFGKNYIYNQYRDHLFLELIRDSECSSLIDALYKLFENSPNKEENRLKTRAKWTLKKNIVDQIFTFNRDYKAKKLTSVTYEGFSKGVIKKILLKPNNRIIFFVKDDCNKVHESCMNLSKQQNIYISLITPTYDTTQKTTDLR